MDLIGKEIEAVKAKDRDAASNKLEKEMGG